jgi:hypothetical protein
MLIFSFDCAAKNLGVCVCYFNENWKAELEEHVKNINVINNMIKDNKLEDPEDVINNIYQIITNFLNNIFKLMWFNTVDLMPGINIKNKLTLDISINLKSFLSFLDSKFGKPDLVLIEHQMKVNDISRIISYQIMYHYVEEQNKKNNYELKLPQQTLQQTPKQIPQQTPKQISHQPSSYAQPKPTIIYVLSCNVKNSYSFSNKLEYFNFIEKYSKYTANKKHTLANFKFYLENLHHEKIQFDKKDKLDDASDAFMMVYGYLKNVKKAL